MQYTVKLYGKANVSAYAQVEASNGAEAVRLVLAQRSAWITGDPEILGDVEWKYDGLDEIFENASEAWPGGYSKIWED